MANDLPDLETKKFGTVGNERPVKVIILDNSGNQITFSGLATSAKQDTVIGELQALNSLVPDSYDYISLSYTGDNLTGVIFKTGGSGGTTVSTLTLAYTGAVLDSVTKT